MLAARKLRDRAWEIHQAAAGTRKIVLEGDADPEKYWRPANPRGTIAADSFNPYWPKPAAIKLLSCGQTDPL